MHAYTFGALAALLTLLPLILVLSVAIYPNTKIDDDQE